MMSAPGVTGSMFGFVNGKRTRSLPLPVLTSFTRYVLSVFICVNLWLSLRLLNKILRPGITRRVENPLRLALFHDLAAFHVQQIIGESDQDSNRVRYDHDCVTALHETQKQRAQTGGPFRLKRAGGPVK